VWDATNDQDSALVANAHRGIVSSAYEPGPYSPFTEALVDKFCNWYLSRLAAMVDVAGFNGAPGAAGAARAAHSAAIPAAAKTADVPLAVGADARVFSVTFSQSGHTVPLPRGSIDPRGCRKRGPATAVFLPRRQMRQLPIEAGLRTGGHEARRRHSPTSDRYGRYPRLLQPPAVGSCHR
jgi:Ring hydroxylating alpha subunit (catalytic domain)